MIRMKKKITEENSRFQLLDFFENPNLGVFCRSNDNIAFIQKGLLKKVKRRVITALDVKLVEITIAESTIIGSLIAMNSKGVVVTDLVDEGSYNVIESQGLDVFVIDEKINAAGNDILEISSKGEYKLSLLDMAAKAIKGIAEPKLLLDLNYLRIKMNEISAHYKNFPSNIDKFEFWKEKAVNLYELINKSSFGRQEKKEVE